jgi:hypothetical protein
LLFIVGVRPPPVAGIAAYPPHPCGRDSGGGYVFGRWTLIEKVALGGLPGSPRRNCFLQRIAHWRFGFAAELVVDLGRKRQHVHSESLLQLEFWNAFAPGMKLTEPCPGMILVALGATDVFSDRARIGNGASDP